ncbi:unnamed protein product, partial [Brassica oleracea var. botrytis]
TSEEHVSQGRFVLSKPSLEDTCRKIRSPPLFPDMQDAADTLNGIHRKTHRKNKIPRSNITHQMVKKIFHHSRKETRPNTVLEPFKPTTDPHFEESNQSSTIDPRTANVESQIESRLSEESAKARITDQEAGEKRCCQSHRFPEPKSDESSAGGATDPRNPKLARTV